MKAWTIVMAAIAISACDAHAEPKSHEYARFAIYYYGWDITTGTSLTPAWVRENAKTKTLSSDPQEVSAFVRWLGLESRPVASDPGLAEDVRLVIDLWDAQGQRVTLFANRFALSREDGKATYPIDLAFRQRFTFSTVH
jgi:hypothetical protein